MNFLFPLIDGHTTGSIEQSWGYVDISPDERNPVWQKSNESSLSKEQKLKGSSITVFEMNIRLVGEYKNQ